MIVEPAFGSMPLTPVEFLSRAAHTHRDRPAYRDGERSLTYSELAERCAHLAGAISGEGVDAGDRVSVLSPNTYLSLEAHFGVPWAGAVLNALNTRLSAMELAFIIDHAGASLLLVDHELKGLAQVVLSKLDEPPRLVVAGGAEDEYERWLHRAERRDSHRVADEGALLSINYTSGTTGQPKGVMYAHRGAYLQALAMMAHSQLDNSSVFLWTLPMFHCNGWCFPWAVTAAAGVHIGLRKVEPGAIWRAISDEGVTHFNAAPTVLAGLANHDDARTVSHPVRVATGGAPPSPALLSRLAELNLHATHLYGLTETYGPAVICDWQPQWDTLETAEQARHKARQGVSNVIGRPVRVVDAGGHDVPPDGKTSGEVVLRGNNVMLGYFRDPTATADASVPGPGGRWFRTGDIGVLHANGYLELRDRAKDVIISGGENITSIEVEQALSTHPAVLECAVVAQPDDVWGEVPVAFVTLRSTDAVTEADLIQHVKQLIARYKAPRSVHFGELPKTATGKIQKFVLRERARRG